MSETCINPNSKEYKEVVKKSDNNPIIANALIRRWQKETKSPDIIPSYEQLKSFASTSVKDDNGKIIKINSKDSLVEYLKQQNIITKETLEGDYFLRQTEDKSLTKEHSSIQDKSQVDNLAKIKGENINKIKRLNQNFKKHFNTSIDLINEYLLQKNIVKFNEEGINILNKRELYLPNEKKYEPKQTIPDEQLDDRLREFLKKLGIKVNIDSVLNEFGEPINDVIARAKFVKTNLQAVIDIVKGKQGYDTLTEETAHFVLWMLRGTPLYNSMYNDVVKTDVYKQVKKEYADKYTSELQFREEAITKLITESLIEQYEKGTKLTLEQYNEVQNRIRRWWNKVIDFLNDLLNNYSVNAYDVAAMQILFGDTEGLSLENIDSDSEMYQLDENSLRDKIKEYSNLLDNTNIIKDNNHKYSEGEYNYKYNVTSLINKNNFPDRTEKETKYDNFIKEVGTKGHEDFNNSLQRAIEFRETGTYKTAMVSNIPSIRNEIDSLVEEILNSYGTNAKFFTEKTIGDKSNSVAGTMDFFVIFEENGKIKGDILDFKFLNFKKHNGKVVLDEMPKYKKEQYQEQLERYKKILQNRYNFKFQINASLVPINVNIEKDFNDNYTLKSINIGSTKFSDVNKHLNFIPLESNKTGNETVDKVLEGLIAQRNIILKTEKSTDSIEANKRLNRLQILNNSIKKLQLSKDLEDFFIEANNELDNIISGEPTVDKIEAAGEIIPFYKSLNFIEYLSEFQNDTDKLKTIKDKISIFRDKLEEVEYLYNKNLDLLINDLSDKLGVSNINLPQKDIGFWGRFVNYFSQSENPHIKALYKLWIRAKDTSRLAYEKDLEEIDKLNKEVIKYNNVNGISSNDAYSFMIKRDNKGNAILINKYSKDFTDKINKAREEKDYEFIAKYYEFDRVKYEEKYKETEEFYKERYKNNPEKDRIIKKALAAYSKQYDVRNSNYAILNKNNRFIKLKESPDLYSKEYRHIMNTPELKAFYEYFTHFISKSRRDLGLELDYKFIPQILQTTVEAINQQGSSIDFKDRLYQELSTSENGSFNEVNALTGNMEYKISMPYQAKLGRDASVDLGKVLALWSKSYHDTIQLRDIEKSAKLLQQHLELQKFYTTTITGAPKYKKGTEELELLNAENSQTLVAYNDFLNQAIYKINSKTKAAYNTVRKKVVRDAEGNAKLDENGNKIYEEQEVSISIDKIVQKILSYISGKALGLNIISAGANLGGGLANGYYIGHKGQLYTKAQFTRGIKIFTAGGLNPTTKVLMRYFDVTGNMEGFNKANALSVSAAEKFLTYDKLYYLQKKTDEYVNNSVLFAMLQSHGLDSNNQIKKLSQLPEETKSLLDSAVVENDKLVIKGLTDNEDKTEYLNFRRKVNKTVEKILGVSPDYDIRLLNQSIGGRLLMQFRNWLPRMAEERFNIGVKYNENLEEFERGNYISFISFLRKNTLSGLADIAKLSVGLGSNIEESLGKKWELLDPQTKQKFLDNTSSEEEAKAAYISMEKGNLKATILEVQVMLFITGLLAFLKDGDDDEDGLDRMAIAITDRLNNEISFFINPISATEIIKSPVASSSSIVDAIKLTQDLFIETTGQIIGDDEMTKKAKPLKRAGKMFPLLKEGIKDMDIIFNEE